MKRASGIFLLLIGVLVAFIEVLAVLDPTGSKMADDANPFGSLPSWGQQAIYILAVVALFYFGFRLINQGNRRVTPSKMI